ncbi:hypothetical protein J4731_20945 [Providencia rettgeri]|nr:hypothetical protein [Providencia rettgeri]
MYFQWVFTWFSNDYIFTIIRASYWTICFPIFKKTKNKQKIVKGEAETINSDVTEGETQREISDIEEEYIPETLPIIISVNQKYKEHLEDNRFLSRMKKIFLFDTDIGSQILLSTTHRLFLKIKW